MTLPEATLEDSPAPAPLRKFTILDGMILVAVTAFGLAWNVASEKNSFTYNYVFNQGFPILRALNSAMWIFQAHLILWSLAIGAIGLFGPRRLLRDKVKQPGLAACWAASLAILFKAAWYLPFRLQQDRGNVLTGGLMIQTFEEGMFAVVGAWMVLAVSGLWEPRRDWIDRVGRVLGVLWIVATSYYHFRDLFW
jgi:hypothetical protein